MERRTSRFVPKKPQIKLGKRGHQGGGGDLLSSSSSPSSGREGSGTASAGPNPPGAVPSPSSGRFARKSAAAAPSGTAGGTRAAGGTGTGRPEGAAGASGPGTRPGQQRRQPFETSDGAMRLNRILDSAPGGGPGGLMMSSPVPSAPLSPYTGTDPPPPPGPSRPGAPPPPSASSSSLPGPSDDRPAPPPATDYIPPSTVQLADPTDEGAVGGMACRITPKLRVDPRSIGGRLVGGDGKVEARTGSVVLRENWNAGGEEDGEDGAAAPSRSSPPGPNPGRVGRLTNECLFAMCISHFDLSVGHSSTAGGKKRHIPIAKSRNKLRYAVILRSTNRPLLRPAVLSADGNAGGAVVDDDDDDGGGGGYGGDGGGDGDGGDGLGADDNYDHLYNPDPRGDASSSPSSAGRGSGRGRADASPKKAPAAMAAERRPAYDSGVSPRHEISSFPALHCMAIHSDGTKPDVRKVLELDRLVSIENLPPKKGSPAGSAGTVALVFRNGDAVEIDCDLPNAVLHSTTGGGGSGTGGGGTAAPLARGGSGMERTNRLRKERFLWSLLQVHAMLCTAVAERGAAEAAGRAANQPGGSAGRAGAGGALPPLKVRNVDRGELQYISTVNGFLADSPVLCSLLDRQSGRDRGPRSGRDGDRADGGGEDAGGGERADGDGDEAGGKGKGDDAMDGMAYDMMMGNYNRVALFANDEEKSDAADVLNAARWRQEEHTADGLAVADASATADSLVRALQQRMKDLEKETCRRLISWEDEKHHSALGGGLRPPAGPGEKDGGGTGRVDAMSLNDLFRTLEGLDAELESMESWIDDRAAQVRPVTDECRGIEEENRMLEQQWVSFENLGNEMRRLLGGLVLPTSLMRVLHDPGSVIRYDRFGYVDVDGSEGGVELIHQAGRALKAAIDAAEGQGGIHLRAVSDTVRTLSATSNNFCGSLARLVVTVMEQLAKGVCSGPDAAIGKGDTHTSIAKKIRESQRHFQASLLAYIKIIEVLALLQPGILPAVRDAYSELVAEEIMSKRRMKSYFASLPGRTSVKIADDNRHNVMDIPGRTSASATHDLGDYTPVSLRHPNAVDAMMKPVKVEDIEAALSEMLPLIAREAYFTAALFGLSSRHADGRQKKRNFEAAKRSVDNSSQYFRYYISRICGIASEVDAEGKKVKGDAMLSLVASIHLNEAMDGYIDRNKRGGDHSLSLAYVRATILDLRKKVDKQWVIWVEEQIKWIRTNPGVPTNGKRAGVFSSISRLPSYLDHVLLCCRAGRPKDYSPNLAKIKVVSYYLQKMASALFASLNECAERETTDQQYAANVMRMENSYFFTQSMKQRGVEMTALFQKQITGASVICKQSTDAYLGWMIKREFKAMHSLFSNISRIRKEVGDADVPIHVPRAQFVRTLQKESSREIMREKIGVVYARMEKHLSESGGLLPVAWKALVKVLYEWFGRWEKLSTSCYKFILEPSAIDVVRIAKSASGSSSTKKTSARTSDMKSERHNFVSI